MIENTSARVPLEHLIGAGSYGLASYVTGMESAGQHQLKRSDLLPSDMHDDIDAFTALGFTFGEPDPADPLFRPATLPDGWTKQRSVDHDMWSYIVDTNDRIRVEVFYKAAYYDRDAFMRLRSPNVDIRRLVHGEITELPVDDWTPREYWLDVAIPAARIKIVGDIERYQENEDIQALEALDRELARLGA